MTERERIKQEMEKFRKTFNLTEEEIEGYLDFFYKEEKPRSRRVLNSIGDKNG